MPVIFNKSSVKPASNCTGATQHKSITEADKFAKSMEPTLLKLAAKGIIRPRAVARALNNLDAITFRGHLWHSTTVIRLHERLGAGFKAELKTISLQHANAAMKKALS